MAKKKKKPAHTQVAKEPTSLKTSEIVEEEEVLEQSELENKKAEPKSKKARKQEEEKGKGKGKGKDKKKKKGIFKRIGNYFRDLKNELKKVVWPTKKRVLHNTIVVLVMIILIGILICILDLIFNGAISLLFGNVS